MIGTGPIGTKFIVGARVAERDIAIELVTLIVPPAGAHVVTISMVIKDVSGEEQWVTSRLDLSARTFLDRPQEDSFIDAVLTILESEVARRLLAEKSFLEP